MAFVGSGGGGREVGGRGRGVVFQRIQELKDRMYTNRGHEK